MISSNNIKNDTQIKNHTNWWVLTAIGTGSLMAALDGSVVNTILPVLRTYFEKDIASIQWVSTIYLLILSGFLLTFGRLGDIHGHKKIYLVGFLLFIISSGLCGIALSLPLLIFFRGTQALGGAMLASNAPAIVTGSFPSHLRGRAFGLVSLLTYLGLTLGPSLGGWLTHFYGWRMVFYINIPIGLVGFILSTILVPRDTLDAAKQPFDFFGAVAFLIWLSTLMIWMNKGADIGWGSPPIIALLLISFASLVLFIFIERRINYPMVNFELFRAPLFSNSVLSSLINYVSLFSISFLLPFYLIQGLGFDPSQAGLLLSIQPIMMALSAPISGAFSDRFGSRIPGMIGMAGMAAGLFMLSRIGPATNILYVEISLALAGIGTGIFIAPNTSALMGAAPKTHQGIASGIQAASRNVGMVLGIGLAGAILSSYLAQNSTASFYKGINTGFFVAAFVALAGIFTSAIKEK